MTVATDQPLNVGDVDPCPPAKDHMDECRVSGCHHAGTIEDDERSLVCRCCFGSRVQFGAEWFYGPGRT